MNNQLFYSIFSTILEAVIVANAALMAPEVAAVPVAVPSAAQTEEVFLARDLETEMSAATQSEAATTTMAVVETNNLTHI